VGTESSWQHADLALHGVCLTIVVGISVRPYVEQIAEEDFAVRRVGRFMVTVTFWTLSSAGMVPTQPRDVRE